MKLKLITLFLVSLTACATNYKIKEDLEVYCKSSEHSLVKAAGLRLIELAVLPAGASIDLKRGLCERYYSNRNLDYRPTTLNTTTPP